MHRSQLSKQKGSVAIWGSEGDKALDTSVAVETPREQRFSPYEMNGGTVVGIAGDDYCVIATDTRLTQGYSILSRKEPKATQLTSKCIIGSGGVRCDILTLHKVLKIRMAQYKTKHKQEMSSTAIAQLLSTLLYYKRFMPYYAFNVVGGLDSEGKGGVFTYDAIGSYQRLNYACQGQGQRLIIPVLDNLIGFKNRADEKKEYSVDEVVEIVKDLFVTAGERDIHTGDGVVIHVITADGVSTTHFKLKAD